MQNILDIQNISKHFGGVKANQNISLTLQPQSIHALIGPNGAGKSTLVAQISGELKPDAGHIYFKQKEITHCNAEQRNRLGLGRIFQTTSLFNELSVLDNIRIPLLRFPKAQNKGIKSYYQPLSTDKDLQARALLALEKLGLEKRRDVIAATLSHGEQRQLEMAMTLATQPSCLLLDEPMAGLSNEESIRMIKLIHTLKADHSILLIEHDMKAVFDLADTISVLVNGKIIATGSADMIRNNPDVQLAYLGNGDNGGYGA